MKQYFVNEIFYSLQGEGMRVGTPNLFLRFGKCNLACDMDSHGFDCDTEFVSGRELSGDEIVRELSDLESGCQWIVLTGGEPSLQMDENLIGVLHESGFKLAIETNGSRQLPDGLDWITVSPKVAEHSIRQRSADEVKYVRGYGQAIPKTVVEARYYLISPAFDGLELDPRTLDWCVRLVKDNPPWRLSVQMHKFWGLR